MPRRSVALVVIFDLESPTLERLSSSCYLLEWKVFEKFRVFPQRIWIFKEEFFKEEFRMAVSTIIIDNLEF